MIPAPAVRLVYWDETARPDDAVWDANEQHWVESDAAFRQRIADALGGTVEAQARTVREALDEFWTAVGRAWPWRALCRLWRKP